MDLCRLKLWCRSVGKPTDKLPRPIRGGFFVSNLWSRLFGFFHIPPYLSTTLLDDDGSSVIEVGSVKLEHQFRQLMLLKDQRREVLFLVIFPFVL